MEIKATKLNGVYLITPYVYEDYRGNFAETYSKREFQNHGLNAEFVEFDVSMARHNVLKGIHGDTNTYKLMECVFGEVYDVVVNCDKNSSEFGKWQSFILSESNRCAIYVPPMCGNCYYVLSDKAVFIYKKSEYFEDVKEFTYRWNDPYFKIEWPTQNPIVSTRDKDALLINEHQEKGVL